MSEPQQKHPVGEVLNLEDLSKKEQIKVRFYNKEISQAKALIDLAYDAAEEFFICDLGIAATVKVHQVKQNFLLDEIMFSRWLINEYYSLFQDSPKSFAVKEAINTIISKEEFNNQNRKDVFNRVASYEQKVYIDLGNDAFEVVEISKDGWKIINNPPVKFIRMKTMRALSVPRENGDVKTLRNLFMLDDQQFNLWLSFIFGCLNPKGPFPILVLQGAQGSGKTLLAEITKAIIDLHLPRSGPCRNQRKT